MSNKQKFISLLALFASISLIVACSSSTSSSGGSGQIPTGTYNGTFSGAMNLSPFSVTINGQLSVVANGATTTGADGTTNTNTIDVSGNLAVTGHSPVDNGVRCFTGGSITGGSVNGNQMVLEITTIEAAMLTMTGRVTDDSYSGTFSADDSNCPGLSGNFSFSRI